MESVIVECYPYEIPTLKSVSEGQFSNDPLTRHTSNQSVTALQQFPDLCQFAEEGFNWSGIAETLSSPVVITQVWPQFLWEHDCCELLRLILGED